MPKKVKSISDVKPDDDTTIRLKWKTKFRLLERGVMLEDADDLINRILDKLDKLENKK